MRDCETRLALDIVNRILEREHGSSFCSISNTERGTAIAERIVIRDCYVMGERFLSYFLMYILRKK